MSQSLAISAASTRFGVGIKRGVRPSSCQTSLGLSSASFECFSLSTKCTVLLVHLSSSCFKVILRRRRLTSVSTGRVFLSAQLSWACSLQSSSHEPSAARRSVARRLSSLPRRVLLLAASTCTPAKC